ncbi:MAG: hypothetical protein LKJ75_00980 [Clostridia bacterium]|nr:hypothetical protein [Clostridia bacterium]MCI2013760.1 hypothetical protein [Clostridia bacterium]
MIKTIALPVSNNIAVLAQNEDVLKDDILTVYIKERVNPENIISVNAVSNNNTIFIVITYECRE